MKHCIGYVLGAVIALAGAGTASSDDFDYCLVCHGANGNGNAAIRAPKISGMESWYIAQQLEAFATGLRGTPEADAPGHEMGPIGIRLKQEGRVDAAVQFIGSLKSEKPAHTVSGDARQGKHLYAVCASCHGVAGEGNQSMHAPALAARTDWYLVAQLNNFKEGLRGADPADTYGAQMRAVAATLGDDKAVADVVAYIDTLGRN